MPPNHTGMPPTSELLHMLPIQSTDMTGPLSCSEFDSEKTRFMRMFDDDVELPVWEVERSFHGGATFANMW